MATVTMEIALSAALFQLDISDTSFDSGYGSEPSSSITSPTDTADFNDRSIDNRDARLANSILALDEDMPEDLDDSIKSLLQKHTSMPLVTRTTSLPSTTTSYKLQQAAKKAAIASIQAIGEDHQTSQARPQTRHSGPNHRPSPMSGAHPMNGR